jgi:integrase
MNIGERVSEKGDKIYYYYDLGRGKGQRPSVGLFSYVKPKNAAEKQHNIETRALLAIKKGQAILDQQAIGTGYIPEHKFKANFLDYYEGYVEANARKGNRHLANSLVQFKKFIHKDFLAPVEVTENLSKQFRRYLLDHFTGETPLNYFARFKWVVNAATSDGYFRTPPTEKVVAKSNPSTTLKEILEVEDYFALLKTPCVNQQVQLGFLLTCYTGLRWCDVKKLHWRQLVGKRLTTRIIQKKTGQPVVLFLHPVALSILQLLQPERPAEEYQNQLVFVLPNQDGCNMIIDRWMKTAGIDKHITWSCGRTSFSVLLQDKNVDDATVAYLMGHTTTRQVNATYKRHRPKDQTQTITNLPMPDELPVFLAN